MREHAEQDARDFTAEASPELRPRRAATIDHFDNASIQAEEYVLSCMMHHSEALAVAIPLLRAEAFSSFRNRAVFAAMKRLFDRGYPVNLITVTDGLRQSGELDAAGGPSYLADLFTPRMMTTGRVEHYAGLIRRAYQKRQLQGLALDLYEKASDETTDADRLMEEAENGILAVSRLSYGQGFHSLDEGLEERLREIEAMDGSGGVTGIPTGFDHLDSLTGGWQASDLIVLAARPGMGKTAFVLGQAKGASRNGHGVGYFSLEMGWKQLRDRLWAQEARLDLLRLRTGNLSMQERNDLRAAMDEIATLPIFIDDTPGLSITALRAKARQIHHRQRHTDHPIGLIVVDYLQLVHADVGRNGSREQEIAAISRGLKELAKELNVPVIALAQLSRAVDARSDKRPTLSDLRESGAIEQDADVVGFIFRPEVYGITVDEYGNSTQGIAEIIIGKQRNGPIGTCKVQFASSHAEFRPLSSRTPF